MNLGPLAGLRLRPSRVVHARERHLRSGKCPGVASPAQGLQRPKEGRIARSHLQETRSRLLVSVPEPAAYIPRRSSRRVRGNRRGTGRSRPVIAYLLALNLH